jgi:hypothetical protein
MSGFRNKTGSRGRTHTRAQGSMIREQSRCHCSLWNEASCSPRMRRLKERRMSVRTALLQAIAERLTFVSTHSLQSRLAPA